MTPIQLSQAIHEADQLSDFLNQVGWDDVLRPQLAQERDIATKQLVASVLGNPITASDGTTVTAEQLAGRIYGIDFIERKINSIIRKGCIAAERI